MKRMNEREYHFPCLDTCKTYLEFGILFMTSTTIEDDV